jgi:hypothetical protein
VCVTPNFTCVCDTHSILSLAELGFRGGWAMASTGIPVWKLELLRYPRVLQFTPTAQQEVASLVSFLEDRHIRMWSIEERAPLRQYGPAWLGAFDSFLKVRG